MTSRPGSPCGDGQVPSDCIVNDSLRRTINFTSSRQLSGCIIIVGIQNKIMIEPNQSNVTTAEKQSRRAGRGGLDSQAKRTRTMPMTRL